MLVRMLAARPVWGRADTTTLNTPRRAGQVNTRPVYGRILRAPAADQPQSLSVIEKLTRQVPDRRLLIYRRVGWRVIYSVQIRLVCADGVVISLLPR